MRLRSFRGRGDDAEAARRSPFLSPRYAPDEFRGLRFVPSMATGALLLAPPVAAAQLRAEGASAPLTACAAWLRSHLASAALPWGAGAGAVYGLGLCLSVQAVDALDYAVAYTVAQGSILVAGAWGLLLYREIEGAGPVALFAASGAVLVAGAALVGYYGTTDD